MKCNFSSYAFRYLPTLLTTLHNVFISPLLKFYLQILTKDSVTVFVNAIMYYKVKVTTKATFIYDKHILNYFLFCVGLPLSVRVCAKRHLFCPRAASAAVLDICLIFLGFDSGFDQN